MKGSVEMILGDITTVKADAIVNAANEGLVRGGGENEPALLASCYDKSLALAHINGLKSVAFPSISTGIFGYPTEAAAKIAVERALAFVEDHAMKVMWVLFDEKTKAIYDETLAEAK